MRFKFTVEYPEYSEFGEEVVGTARTTTMEFEESYWPVVLNNFMLFLKGSGFYVEADSVLINDTKHPLLDTDMLDHIDLLSEQGE